MTISERLIQLEARAALLEETIKLDPVRAFEWGRHEEQYMLLTQINFLREFEESEIDELEIFDQIESIVSDTLPLKSSNVPAYDRSQILKINALTELKTNLRF